MARALCKNSLSLIALLDVMKNNKRKKTEYKKKTESECFLISLIELRLRAILF